MNSDLNVSDVLPHFDILTKIMGFSVDQAEETVSRMKIQKLEELKMQILAQNPQILGIGCPGLTTEIPNTDYSQYCYSVENDTDFFQAIITSPQQAEFKTIIWS